MTRLTALAFGVCTALATLAARADETSAEFFELHVRPVLAGTCFKCHGGETTSGGLRVDSREALVKGGEHGPALVPGRAAESLLIRAVRHESDELRMPPDEPLAREQIEALATWIDRGAAWPETVAADAFADGRHWAFTPLAHVAPPLATPGESTHPIDRFIAARRHEQGLTPVAPTDRRTLLRRMSFDLIGLPPDPEEVARFERDDSPEALAALVERLLSSPRYGERWGRHWLDVVRYADTAGDNADYPVPEARLYRDYVIDSFNADKPYDEFVREQLAGDILAAEHVGEPERYRELIVATGYLALSRRYATAPYELWHLTLEDAIDTTGRAFLGLTLRCARCHDHKFDPVMQRDYYALYGIFASTQFPWAGGEEFHSKKTPRQHFAPLAPPEEVEPRRRAMQDAIERLSAELNAAEKEDKDSKPAKRLRKELRTLEQARQLDAPPEVSVAYAVREGPPVDAKLHLRGEPEHEGEVAPRGMPAFLSTEGQPAIPPGASGRLQLAHWLTRPEHPLTARVMANRVWQWHFGRGLVETASNFGLRGASPSHPELLDWLAWRLIDSGWSIKALHREILLSETYALASGEHAGNQARDPENRYYWRGTRRRLDAEALRDAMLAVSGGLDLSRPGEHPFPPVAQWKWTQHAPFKAVYPSAHRSVYLMTQRITRHPYLALFDAPDTNQSSEARTSATVPAQALFLMNNPLVSECAARLAERLLNSGSDPATRIARAYLLCYARPATAAELQRGCAYLEEVQGELAKSGASAEEAEREAWTSLARVLLAANEFLYVD